MSWEDQGRQNTGGLDTAQVPVLTHGKRVETPSTTVFPVIVTSLKDPSRSIHVTVTDRGPYIDGRVIDLTPAAFQALFGSTKIGVGPVVVVPEDNPQRP